MKLYRDRYLIAIYDNEDNLIDVGCNGYDFLSVNYNAVYQALLRGFKSNKTVVNCRKTNYRYFIIDCKEKHDDCFAEEDEKFLEWINAKPSTCKEKAKELGVNLRTYMRYKHNNKLKHLYNKKGVPYVDADTTEPCY